MESTIIYDLKKGTLGYQEKEDGTAEPITIPFEKPIRPVNIDEVLVPSMKILPNWYKRLNKKKHYEHEATLSVKTCVSFITLFKNSYCFCSPVDFKLHVERMGYEVEWDKKKEKRGDFVHFTSHTHSPTSQVITSGNQVENQLGPYFDKNYLNLKIDTAMNMKSKRGRVDLIIMPAFWWIPDSPLQAMQGVLPILDTYDTGLNLNLWIRKDKKKTITIKKGTPLAMFYSPTGPVNWVKGNIKSVLPELGKYPVETRKCPYAYTLEDESNR